MFEFLKRRNKSPKDELTKLLGDYTLPSFPGVALELMGKIRDPEVTSSQIGEVLAMDPGLSIKVLQMANSATFAPRNEVENVEQAVTMIGLSALETIVLAGAAGETMPKESAPGYAFDRFWHMSCVRGVVARGLAGELCPAQTNQCFLAGFLQDLAIPFLADSRAETYGPILERWHSEPGTSLAEMEREAFGWDHGEVATWILSEWNLPEALASAIGGHHHPDEDEYDCPAPVGLVAHLREEDAPSGEASLIADATGRHGISEEVITGILENSIEQASGLARLMH